MHRSIAFSLALLWCCPAVPAAAPTVRTEPAQYQAIHSQRMATLAPSLRQWVVEEGRRRADSGPDIDEIAGAVRVRLAGQDFSAMDVNALVQMVLRESYRQTTEDLRAVMEEMKTVNEQERAQREAARKARQRQKESLRDAYEQRSSTTSVERPLQAKLAPIQDESDSLSELSEEQQLKMQMYMDRMTKADAAMSNAMKKFSETSSTIVSNLK